MAHFLTTNWTDKIKNNPVANMILNSNRIHGYEITIRDLQRVPHYGYINSDYIAKNSRPHSMLFPSVVRKNAFAYRHESERQFIDRFNEKQGKRKWGKKPFGRWKHSIHSKWGNKQFGRWRKDAKGQGAQLRQGRQGKIIGRQNGKHGEGQGAQLRQGRPAHGEDLPPDILGQGQAILLPKDGEGPALIVGANGQNDDVNVQSGIQGKMEMSDSDDDSEINSESADLHDGGLFDSDNESLDMDEGYIVYENGEASYGGDMWANTYVKDFINIHHPKQRAHVIDRISRNPLSVKGPSIFFSDV